MAVEATPEAVLEPQVPKRELSPSMKEGFSWVKSHEEELLKDADFDFHKPVAKFYAEAVRDDFSITPSAKKLLNSGIMEEYVAVVQHEKTPATALLTRVLAGVDAQASHPADPQEGWLNTIRREGDQNNPDNISTRAGVYCYRIRPDNQAMASGTMLQRSIAQLSLELAATNGRFASQKLKNVREPPAVLQKRTNLVSEARNYKRAGEKKKLAWQANPDLDGITKAYAGQQQTRDALLRALDGELRYRTTPANVGSMIVRLIREDRFMDVSVNEFLSARNDAKDSLGQFLKGNTAVMEGITATWQTFDKLPDAAHDPVVFSVSVGGNPRPDSAQHIYGRSGRSVTHVHVNEAYPNGKTAELYQSHLSADGAPEKAIAFSVARQLEAYSPAKPAEQIMWRPPLTKAESLTREEYVALNAALVESGTNVSAQKDNPLLLKLVKTLGLSDVVVSGSLPPETYGALQQFATTLDTAYMAPLRKKLTGMMTHDGVSPEAQKLVVNRLVTTTITPTKAADLLARLFFGPTAVCGEPFDKSMGVHLTSAPSTVKVHHDELLARIGDGTLSPDTLFSAPPEALAASLKKKGIGKKEYPDWIAGQLKAAVGRLAAEYSFLYFGSTPLMTFLEATDGWRDKAESGAILLTPDLADESVIRAQHSAVGANSATVDGKTVYLEAFESALSHEPSLAIAWATMDEIENGKIVGTGSLLRYNMTPELLQSLDITSDVFRKNIVPTIPALIAPDDPEEQKRIASRMQGALTAWDVQLAALRKQRDKGFLAPLLNAVTTEVEPPQSPALIMTHLLSQEPNLMPGIQYLLLGGLQGFTRQFYTGSAVAATRYTAIAAQQK